MTRDPDKHLADLARRFASADAAVKAHPEPRNGPAFDAKVRSWQLAYRALLKAAARTGAA